MRVKLIKPHTHGGRLYPPAADLDLRPEQAGWLVALGVAEALETPTPDKPAKRGE
jgi:hypothetical protein